MGFFWLTYERMQCDLLRVSGFLLAAKACSLIWMRQLEAMMPSQNPASAEQGNSNSTL